MPLPNSKLAYLDCYDIMDKALADGTGVRAKLPSRDSAWHFRLRCNKARSIDREFNAQVHEPGEAMYGQTEYAKIMITIREIDSSWWVYFKINRADALEIESLGNGEPAGEAQWNESPSTDEHTTSETSTAPGIAVQTLKRRL